MKTSMLRFIFVILIACPVAGEANDGKFVEMMKKHIQAAYEAKDVASMQNAVNGFERIASVEKDRWEPLYYIAYGYIMMANMEGELSRRDFYLDHAEEALKPALKLAPQESEIIALSGFASMIRITVDPQSRGMAYAPQATQAFEQALALNPENPRAWGLMAQMQFGTAQFFGASTADACAANNKAAEKIVETTPQNPLMPTWGRAMIESLKEKCR